MRRLIIYNHFSLLGLFSSLKVYLADSNGDIELNGNKYKYLGSIKNNSQQAFEIDEEEHMLCFAFAEVSSYAPTYQTIPSGKDEVRLSGVRKFRPELGNPFILDK